MNLRKAPGSRVAELHVLEYLASEGETGRAVSACRLKGLKAEPSCTTGIRVVCLPSRGDPVASQNSLRKAGYGVYLDNMARPTEVAPVPP